ncbi:MAG: hypothetical protein MJ053_03690, partial [Elusimicrobiaceae bacterium]|nr:hypothetical protein [Elusimicrobiaceae bacterium]
MYKRFLTLLAGLLLLSNTSYGQLRSGSRSVRSLSRNLSKPTVSQVLSKRVTASYKKASQTLIKYPDVCANALASGPATVISPRLDVLPKELYPDVPFLGYSRKKLTNYFLTRQNRELSHLAPQLHAMQQSWLANIPNFQQAQVPLMHPAAEDIRWLVRQIPTDTSYLLIGESHLGTTDMANQVARLLHELRLQQPNRKIVLFTEFLPAPDVPQEWFKLCFSNDTYAPVWQAATENNIPIFGLEPHFALWDMHRMYFISANPEGHDDYTLNEQSIWASIEGIRLRNASWLSTIKALRETLPEALFVIYTGTFHVSSRYPFALSTALQKEN